MHVLAQGEYGNTGMWKDLKELTGELPKFKDETVQTVKTGSNLVNSCFSTLVGATLSGGSIPSLRGLSTSSSECTTHGLDSFLKMFHFYVDDAPSETTHC